jgi:hypothetical protein
MDPKAYLLTFLLIVGFSAIGQSSEKAIGVRTGGGYGFGGELNIQWPFKGNRLEVGLGGFATNRYNGLGINGVYQFIQPLSDGFRFYYGVGGHISSFSRRNHWDNNMEGRLGILAQAGVEYFFTEIPLQLSLDARPGLFVGHRSGLGIDLGLGARYYF